MISTTFDMNLVLAPQQSSTTPSFLTPTNTAWGNQSKNNAFQSNVAFGEIYSPEPLAGLGIRYTSTGSAVEHCPRIIVSDGAGASIPGKYCSPRPNIRRRQVSRTETHFDFFLEELGSVTPSQTDNVQMMELTYSPCPGQDDIAPTTSDEFSIPTISYSTSSKSQTSDDQDIWSFESLSAAAGMSVDDLAAQISASAEIALQQFAPETLYSSSSNSSMDSASDFSAGHQRTTSVSINSRDGWMRTASTPEMTLPIADINMNLMYPGQTIGVNPADIMPPVPQSCSFWSLAQESPSDLSCSLPVKQESHLKSEDSEVKFGTATVDHLSWLRQNQWLSNGTQGDEEDRKSDFDLLLDRSSPSSSSPVSNYVGRSVKRSTRFLKDNAVQKAIFPDFGNTSLEMVGENNTSHLPPINLGTPVLNAHLGIDILDLKAKAERYRLRNQGREYDKNWLISFVGKLSCRGELVKEFRCYVMGCNQTNKRRDHILIHVGAHLDQRPFKCPQCSSRFLRRNECKRHELSHSGARPFCCHLCPSAVSTFVRQDLLKRHIKRTHHIDSDKENSPPDGYRPHKRGRHN